MNTVWEIEDAVQQLCSEKLAAFRTWFVEYHAVVSEREPIKSFNYYT